MKKYIYLLLALTFAGATMSCEKEQLPNRTNPNEVVDEDANKEKLGINGDLVGCWFTTFNIDGYGVNYERTLYLWNNGKGYNVIDDYLLDGSYAGHSRGNFEWYAKEDVLYFVYPHEEPIACTFSVVGTTLTLFNEKGDIPEMIFSRRPEADHRFMGDWSIMKKNGDKYVDQHIHFVTPSDCCTYYLVYTNPNYPPTEGSIRPIWYKYEFDNNTITMTGLNGGSAIKKDYKIEGTKLYLNGECYSNFKRENGLE